MSTFTVLFTALLLASLASCTKREANSYEQNIDPGSSIIAIAKNHVNAIANTPQAINTKGVSKQRSGLTRIQALINKIDWDRTVSFDHSNSNYLMVAINDVRKPFKNKQYEFARFLVLQVEGRTVLNTHVVEVLSKPEKPLPENLFQVCKNAILQDSQTKTVAREESEGYVILFDDDYRQINAFEMKDGSWNSSSIRFRSDKEIVQ